MNQGCICDTNSTTLARELFISGITLKLILKISSK